MALRKKELEDAATIALRERDEAEVSSVEYWKADLRCLEALVRASEVCWEEKDWRDVVAYGRAAVDATEVGGDGGSHKVLSGGEFDAGRALRCRAHLNCARALLELDSPTDAWLWIEKAAHFAPPGSELLERVLTCRRMVRARGGDQKESRARAVGASDAAARAGVLHGGHTFRLYIQSPGRWAVSPFVDVSEGALSFELSISSEFGVWRRGAARGLAVVASVVGDTNWTARTKPRPFVGRELGGGVAVDDRGKSAVEVELVALEKDSKTCNCALVQIVFECIDTTDEHRHVVPVSTIPIACMSSDDTTEKEREDEDDNALENITSMARPPTSCAVESGWRGWLGWACRRVPIAPELPTLSLLEAPGDLGIGGKVWDAGLVLLRALASDSVASVRGMSCLELGSGTGIVGLGSAHLGASSVALTDIDEVVPLLSQNVALNPAPACSLSVASLFWGTNHEKSIALADSLALAAKKPTLDYVLLADVVYDPEGYEPLFSTLLALATKHNPTIIHAYRSRHPEASKFFAMFHERFTSTLCLGFDSINAKPGDGPESTTHLQGAADIGIYICQLKPP